MVRCAAVVVCLSAVLLAARPAEAQHFGRNKVQYTDFDFKVIQTEHFDIYYYAEEEEATRHAARMAERWYARFSRVLQHSFSRRQPLVLYASHPHFTQTNVTPAVPGEATGGLTERAKSRIALPFAAGLAATDRVLGHEIAHAFQIDIVKRAGQDAFTLPGWLIEGMAEYLSLGPDDLHTSMWLRDAAEHGQLPALDRLHETRYSPYRHGHALWSFLAHDYGDEILGTVLRSKSRGALRRLEEATGLSHVQITSAWHESITVVSDTADAQLTRPTRLAALVEDGARLHVGPALSPDGDRLMFMSERDRLSLDLFMADATSGAVVRKVLSTAADPHFDSLQYIKSSGAWDGKGERFAMAALSAGRPVLVILNVSGSDSRVELPLDGLGEIYNPSWSPDGRRLVFSGLRSGLSDLFIYSVESGAVQQLTADVYADLHPAWSPDGRTIAFATDRFTSRLDGLDFGPLRVGLLDLATGVVRPAVDDHRLAKQMSPQWAPDGRALYFVSDRDGISNVYRAELETGELRRVTDVRSGVTGITSISPALAVASRAGTLAFSVYRGGRYEIETLDERAAVASPVVTVGQTPLGEGEIAGTLAPLLADARFGLPEHADFPSTPYDDRLRLESIAPPFIGGTTGTGFGGALRASFGLSFADVLRDRQLQIRVRAGTDVDDMALQLSYLNRKGQWNWGVAGGMVPSRFVGARRALARVEQLVTRETSHLRYLHQWGRVAAHYHIDRAQRIELGLGVRRTGFEWQTVTRVIDAAEGRTLSRLLAEIPAARPMLFAEASAAFVHDAAVSGPTGPVLGRRLRLEVEPAVGGLAFADVGIDARRYFMPVRPLTLAVRAEHVGRYGPGAGDPRLTPLVLALQTRVRGYDLRSFVADQCGAAATSCSSLDELAAGRLAVLNAELRAPLLGLVTGDLHYGRVPIEAIAFLDAGFLWTKNADSPTERHRFRSVGAGARANIGGIVLEMTGARPFDRSGAGWTVNLLLRPGW